MKNTKSTTLFCFSPPVMLATIIMETSMLLYVVVRYKMDTLMRLVVLLLFCLALFQLAEYNVCGGMGADAAQWSRVGYVAITMLPAFGFHFLQSFSRRGWKYLKHLVYASAAGWVSLFAFTTRAFSGHVCAGNYVIFQLTAHVGGAYFMYYYALLFLVIASALYFMRTAGPRMSRLLQLYIIGYLIFLVPTTVINNLYPATKLGLPSIMCGFAVLFAFILVFGLVPRLRKPKHLLAGAAVDSDKH